MTKHINVASLMENQSEKKDQKMWQTPIQTYISRCELLQDNAEFDLSMYSNEFKKFNFLRI